MISVVGGTGNVIMARTALLFELGEELRVRVERDGSSWEAIARIRAHIGSDDARVTELEISDFGPREER